MLRVVPSRQMHDFQTYRRPDAASGPPMVTIQSRGAFSLNRGAFVALGAPKAVELLYDSTERIIGLRPADPRVAHSYALRPATRSSHGPFVISAMAFTRHYGIDTNESRRWRASVEDGVLCIDLNRNGTPVSAARRSSDDERPQPDDAQRRGA